MNEHMPECPVEKRLRAGRTVGSQTCICAALRACEERAMNAAREAVEVMDLHGCHPYRFPDCNCLGPQVIAAIDALKEER